MKYFCMSGNRSPFASKACAHPFCQTALKRIDNYLVLILLASNGIACQCGNFSFWRQQWNDSNCLSLNRANFTKFSCKTRCIEKRATLFEKELSDRAGTWHAYTTGVNATFDSEHQTLYLPQSRAISTGSDLGRPPMISSANHSFLYGIGIPWDIRPFAHVFGTPRRVQEGTDPKYKNPEPYVNSHQFSNI